MRTFRIIFAAAGVAAGFALAIGVLGRHVGRDEPAASAGYAPPPETSAEAQAPGAGDGSARPPAAESRDAASASTAGPAAEATYAPAVPEASPERMAEMRRMIADKSLESQRDPMIHALMLSGLARSDSERITDDALDAAAGCLLDALRAQAAEQDEPFDRVLFTLEAVLSGADVDIAETIDAEALGTKAAPCLLAARQEAGFPLPPYGGR